jgi:methylenetetrahydrofolate dehydrogenase (NADP+)/methenyltetrahydrofolate cyclohydrolase
MFQARQIMPDYFYAKITFMQIIDGRKIRDEILESLKARVASLPFAPVFCDILVGDDPASAQYVRMKERTAESLGIKVERAVYPASITTREILSEIQRIAALPNMSGLIVQLPLPEHIDQKAVLDAVPKEIDVDAIGEETSALFYANKPSFIFPTAAAVLAVLDSTGTHLADKNVVVVGQGMLVGKPVAHLLKERGVSVIVVRQGTEHPEEIFKSADVLISATGQANLITGDMLKGNAIVIDAGTSESSGSVAGDVDVLSLGSFSGMLSPVPGGVGPVTVAMLMQNVVISAEHRSSK